MNFEFSFFSGVHIATYSNVGKIVFQYALVVGGGLGWSGMVGGGWAWSSVVGCGRGWSLVVGVVKGGQGWWGVVKLWLGVEFHRYQVSVWDRYRYQYQYRYRYGIKGIGIDMA